MVNTHNHKKGFTLVELLVGITAVSILSMIVGLLMMMPYRSMTGNWDYADLKRDVALAMTSIASDVRVAKSDEEVTHFGDGKLILPANTVRNYSVSYLLEGDALKRYENGALNMSLVPNGVNSFRTWPTNDVATGVQGVGLQLEIESEGGIPIAFSSFFHTRN